MANELNDGDASKLFNEISQAIRDSDSNKLTELTVEPALDDKKVEEQPIVPQPDENQPEEKDEDEGKSPSEEDEQTDEDADEEKDEGKEETKSEMELLQEKLDKLTKENHNLKSQAGRVPHVQKRIRELDKKLEELERKQASPSSQASEKIKPKVDEILKGIKETDAELAEAIAKAIAAATESTVQESAAKERETLTFLREQELVEHQEYEAQRLLDMYPNAIDVFKSKHWSDWKSQQSDRIRGLAESDTADDVALAFEKYTKDMTAAYPTLVGDTKAEPSAPDIDAAEKARQIEAERQKRKSTAANISSPNAAGKIAVPDDPQALFNKYMADIRKQRDGR